MSVCTEESNLKDLKVMDEPCDLEPKDVLCTIQIIYDNKLHCGHFSVDKKDMEFDSEDEARVFVMNQSRHIGSCIRTNILKAIGLGI